MQEVEYRQPKKDMGEKCEAVLRTVPQWFGRESALRQYVQEIDNLDTYTAWLNDQLIGFFSLHYHNVHAAELHVLAIDAKYHGKGIGTNLYQIIENDLKSQSIKYVQVKTLGPKAQDVNYEKTRMFYLSLGFLPLEEFDTLWGEDTPCLQMVKGI